MAMHNRFAGTCHWCGAYAAPGRAVLHRHNGRWYMIHTHPPKPGADSCLNERRKAGVTTPERGPNYESDHEYDADTMLDYAFADMGMG